MSSPITNTIVLVLIVAVMAMQAYHAAAHTYRRFAFSTASVAFFLLMLFNVKVMVDGKGGPWVVAVIWLVFLLMLVSLVLLLVSWRKGEMDDKMLQVQQAINDERARRRKENNDQHHK